MGEAFHLEDADVLHVNVAMCLRCRLLRERVFAVLLLTVLVLSAGT